MTIPGLPWLPGLTSSINPTRCLTWFLGHPLWAPWVDTILTAACLRGYTHFTLSWPDARQFMTLPQFVQIAQRVKSWGFYVHVKWWSKNYDPIDSTWAQFGPSITPVLSALVHAGALDAVSPWEFNLGNVPGDQGNDIFAGIAQVVGPGVDNYAHFSVEETSWQTDGTSRFDWWDVMAAILNGGLLYQANGAWDMGTRQSRIRDTTARTEFAGGQFPRTFIVWEGDGDTQFDGAQPDETASAGHGFVDCCTPGLVPVSGGGDGLWYPSGAVTLAA